MRHLMMASLMMLLGAACSGREGQPSDISKGDVADAKADGFTDRICDLVGEPPGCDPCLALGWYGDGVCDEFCDEADPDCGHAISCGEGEILCEGCGDHFCVEAEWGCPVVQCAEECPEGEILCEGCGDHFCVEAGLGCPVVQCEELCPEGEILCEGCGDHFCVEAGWGCPVVQCAEECAEGELLCDGCYGDTFCVADGWGCPLVDCV